MTLEELRQRKSEIFLITNKYGISNIRVFGSTVRGEATRDSDVDLLVHISPATGWGFVDCKLEIEDLIHTRIDMVSDTALNRHMAPHILAEATPL